MTSRTQATTEMIGRTIRVPMAETTTEMIGQTFRVPMAEPNPPAPAGTIDLRKLSESDLRDLRRKDPFLYHSIPSVRRADLRGEDVDPSAVLSSAASRENSIVSRKSRLSTECDLYTAMDDLLG